MSATIDEKVLEMRFNNRQFEKGAAQSMRTLDKLKESLKMDNAAKELNKAFDSFSLDSIADSVDRVAERFSNLGMIGASVLQNLTNRAVNMGISFVKSLTIDNIAAGKGKYEMKTQAVQTIVAATRQEGESLEDAMARIEPHLDRLLKYTDETSYDFATMVNNIGKFTSSGIGLEDAEIAMEGIANWAAVSGVGIQEASRAFYNASQAIATGSMKMVDWKSFEMLNMSTAEFKQTVMDTAVAMGVLEKKGDKYFTKAAKGAKSMEVTTANFGETLSKGWFTNDVFMEVLKTYGNTDPGTLGEKAFKAAQEAKTFTDAIQAVQDAVSTQWMQTFEYIFGNYAEAKEFFTDLANELIEVFTAADYARNEILKIWHDDGGREAFMNSISNLWEIFKAIGSTITNSITSMLPVLTSDKLIEWTKSFEQWTRTLGYNLGVFDEAGNVISSVADGLEEVADSAENAAESVEGVSKAIDEAAAKKLYSSLPKEIQRLIDKGETIDYKRTSNWRNLDKYYDYMEASTGQDFSSERAKAKAYRGFGDYQKKALAQIEAGTLTKEQVDTSRWTKEHLKAWEDYWEAVGNEGEEATTQATNGLKQIKGVAKQIFDENGNVIATYFEEVEESATGASKAVAGVTKEIDELKAKQLYNELPKEIQQLIDSGVEIDFKRTSGWRNLDKYYDYLEASTGVDYSSERAKAKAYGGFGDAQKRALNRIDAGEITKDDVDTSKWTAAHLQAWNDYWAAFEEGEAAMAATAESTSETVEESSEEASEAAKEPIKWMAKFQRIAKGVGAAIDIVRKIVQEVVAGVTKVVSKLAPIAEVFVDIFADIGDMVVEFDQKYETSGIKGFFDSIASWLEPVAQNIANAIRGVWESIKGGALVKIIDKIKEIWEKVKTFLKPITTPIVEWFKGLIGKVKDPAWQNFVKLKFQEKFGKAVEALKKAWAAVSEWVSTAYGKVKTWAGPVLKKIGDFFVNLWNSITGWFSGSGGGVSIDFSKIGNFFTDIFKKIGGFFSDIGKAIGSLFGGKETEKQEKAVKKGEKKKGLFEIIGEAIGWVVGSISKVASGLTSAESGFWGLVDWLVDFVGKLYSKVKGWIWGPLGVLAFFKILETVNNVITKGKQKKSVFEKIGEMFKNIGQGFLMFAGAIALISATVYLVGKIPIGIFYTGLIRIVEIMALVMGTMALLTFLIKAISGGETKDVGEAIANIGKGFMMIAIGLLVMVPAVYLFGTMKIDVFYTGLIRVIEILAILTLVTIAISKFAGNPTSILSAAILIVTIAVTLGLIIGAIAILANMDAEGLTRAVDALFKIGLVIMALAAICILLGSMAGPALIGIGVMIALIVGVAAAVAIAGDILSGAFMIVAARLAIAGKNLSIFAKAMGEITNGSDIKKTLEDLFAAMKNAPDASTMRNFDAFTNKLRAFGTMYMNFVGRMNTEGSDTAITNLKDITGVATGLAVEGLAEKVDLFADGMRQLGAAVHLYAIGAAYGADATDEAAAIDFNTLPDSTGVASVVAFLTEIAKGIPDDLQSNLEKIPDSSNMGVFSINLTSLGDAVTAFLGSGIRDLEDDDQTKINRFFDSFLILTSRLGEFNTSDENGITVLSRFAGNVEELGGALVSFGTNLAAEGLDTQISAGITNLESFAKLNETLNPDGPFKTAIGRLFSLGTEYTLSDLSTDITNLGGALGALSDIVTDNGYDQTKVDAGVTAISSFANIKIPSQGGFLDKLVGATDSKKFGDGIGSIGTGLSKWNDVTANPSQNAINLVSTLAGLTVPQEGFVDKIFGATNGKAFGDAIGAIGEGVAKFPDNKIPPSSITAISRLAKIDFGNQGGFWNAVFGTGDQNQFAHNLGAIGEGIKNFVVNSDGKEISENAISSIERLSVATAILTGTNTDSVYALLQKLGWLDLDQIETNFTTVGYDAAAAFGDSFASYFVDDDTGKNNLTLTPVIDDTNIESWKLANGWLFGSEDVTFDPSEAVSKAQVAGHNIEITVDNSDAYDDTEMRTLVSTLDGHIVGMSNLLKNQKIYLNTGLMVGALAPGIDKYLGRRTGR